MYRKIKNKIKFEMGKRFPKILEFYNYKLCDFLYGKINIYDTDITLEKLCSGKISMSRFGDGEFDIMSGAENGFQSSNKDLGQLLKNVIRQNGVHNDFIVGIPRCFNSFDGFTNTAKDFLEDYYLKNRMHCYKFLNTKNCYYDSFVTRLYMDVEDKSKSHYRFNKFKSIWENKNI